MPRFHVARLLLALQLVSYILSWKPSPCFLSFFFSYDFLLLVCSFFANCSLISVVCLWFIFLLSCFVLFISCFFLFLPRLLLASPRLSQSLPKATTWQSCLAGHSQAQTARGAKCLMPLPLKWRQKRIPKRSPKKGKIPNPSRIQSRKGKRSAQCTAVRCSWRRAPRSPSTLGRLRGCSSRGQPLLGCLWVPLSPQASGTSVFPACSGDCAQTWPPIKLPSIVRREAALGTPPGSKPTFWECVMERRVAAGHSYPVCLFTGSSTTTASSSSGQWQEVSDGAMGMPSHWGWRAESLANPSCFQGRIWDAQSPVLCLCWSLELWVVAVPHWDTARCFQMDSWAVKFG